MQTLKKLNHHAFQQLNSSQPCRRRPPQLVSYLKLNPALFAGEDDPRRIGSLPEITVQDPA